MPKVSKKLMRRVQKKSKSLPAAYPWICVPRPEGAPIPKKVIEMNEMLKKIKWNAPGFGPNANK
jgi:hypothetical protein